MFSQVTLCSLAKHLRSSENHWIAINFHSLAKVLRSLKKLFILLRNICIFSQNDCIPLRTFIFSHKICIFSQNYCVPLKNIAFSQYICILSQKYWVPSRNFAFSWKWIVFPRETLYFVIIDIIVNNRNKVFHHKSFVSKCKGMDFFFFLNHHHVPLGEKKVAWNRNNSIRSISCVFSLLWAFLPYHVNFEGRNEKLVHKTSLKKLAWNQMIFMTFSHFALIVLGMIIVVWFMNK